MSDFAMPAGRADASLGGPSNASSESSSREGSRDLVADFEAAFLAEMLKHSGFADALAQAAGGAGESGFTDLLVREVAARISRTRSLGIADAVAPAILEGGRE